MSLNVFLALFLRLCSGTRTHHRSVWSQNRLCSLPSLGTNSFSCRCGLDTFKGCSVSLHCTWPLCSVDATGPVFFLWLVLSLTSVTSVSSYSCPTVQALSVFSRTIFFLVHWKMLMYFLFFFCSPLLFFLDNLIESHGINHQQYPDGSQFYFYGPDLSWAPDS